MSSFSWDTEINPFFHSFVFVEDTHCHLHVFLYIQLKQSCSLLHDFSENIGGLLKVELFLCLYVCPDLEIYEHKCFFFLVCVVMVDLLSLRLGHNKAELISTISFSN